MYLILAVWCRFLLRATELRENGIQKLYARCVTRCHHVITVLSSHDMTLAAVNLSAESIRKWQCIVSEWYARRYPLWELLPIQTFD